MVERGIYKHFKGNAYGVLHVATHTETGERLVIYRKLSDVGAYYEGKVWARPESMFEEIVDGVPRFERIV